MLSTIISDTFGLLGKVVGETVHQTGNLITGTVSTTTTVLNDISNIPKAFANGYDQELFEATTNSSDSTTSASNPFQTAKPIN